jgi:ubiquinone/menaquinone biosynthesis C-methylase UbiE
VGLGWKHQGQFVTFKWPGFVEAPSIPILFARHNYETDVIRRVLGPPRVRCSLEFGCGFGRLTPTIAAIADAHVGVDINAEALAAARDAYPQFEFVHSDGGDLPFPSEAFDLVVTWTVLQHVRPELIDKTLADILRVLSNDGRILLCEETRCAGAPTRHSWHRDPRFYEERLTPLRLTYSSYIDELDRIPGVCSPGRVMLFEGDAQGTRTPPAT